MPDASERHALVFGWSVTPDFASVNFDEPGAVELARLLQDRGVAIEAGLANERAAQALIESSLGSICLRPLLEPDEQDVEGALVTVAKIEARLNAAGIMASRLLHGTESTAWSLFDLAARRGYATRIGLEDTVHTPEGQLTAGNAELVRIARQRLRNLRSNRSRR